MRPAAIAAAILTPSCVADPSAFTDGLLAGAGLVAALVALAAWRTRRR